LTRTSAHSRMVGMGKCDKGGREGGDVGRGRRSMVIIVL